MGNWKKFARDIRKATDESLEAGYNEFSAQFDRAEAAGDLSGMLSNMRALKAVEKELSRRIKKVVEMSDDDLLAALGVA